MIEIPVIGLMGPARSGKSHVGALIAEHWGYMVWAMANPLKMLVYGKYPQYRYEELFGSEDKSEELRKELQLEGTERARDIYGKDIWVRATEAHLRFCSENYGNLFNGVVICDIRFPNEAEAIKRWGGTILRIDNRLGGLSGETAKHQSENLFGSIPHDGVIDNNNRPSKEELLIQIKPYIKDRSHSGEEEETTGDR